MAFGKPKEPKAPKPPKEPKPPKAPKEKKPKKPKKEKPPKVKKGKKGEPLPEAVEGEEQEQGKKKKLPLPLLLIPVVLVAAAALVFFFVIRPRLGGDTDPDTVESVEPEPPELPETISIGDDVEIKGLTLGADESGAVAEKAKTVTYTYSNLVDAGKAAETYVAQLGGESPSFALVDEEFVRLRERPDYTTAEGMVLLARNVPVAAPAATAAPEETPEPTEDPDGEESTEPEESVAPTPEPEPTPPPITYVHTVRITWAPGVCVVTADEQEGMVTAPANDSPPVANHSVSQHGAKEILQEMSPAELGLPGESMDEYEILAMDGTVLVDDRACIRLYVYSDDNRPNSNEIMGSYLMSIDGEHLYKMDDVTSDIIELDYTPR